MIQPEEGKRYVTWCGKITSRLHEIPSPKAGSPYYMGTIDGLEQRWHGTGAHYTAGGYDLQEEYITRTHTLPKKAATDKVGTGLILIPFYSILRIGGIFIEGLRYGKDNWKKGVNDKEYQEERLEHAILHLIKWKEGDRTEDHLAKVAWFCVTQMELERLEKETKVISPGTELKEFLAANGVAAKSVCPTLNMTNMELAT
jgi:hypothetical protein